MAIDTWDHAPGVVNDPDTRAIDGSYSHPYDLRFKARALGWTVPVSVLQDHRLFKRFRQFRDWTKQRHEQEARHALDVAIELRRVHSRLAELAEITYGDQGPLISGVVRDHFPQEVKDTLRDLAHRSSREMDRATTHWRAAGKTLRTWRRLIEEARRS